ncbi:MAG: coenzyme F420-0:L-glutamate ligase [Nocardioides sp.]
MLTVWAPDGVGEVGRGDLLADHLLAALAAASGTADLADGDVVCVTSKIVSKAEGRVEAGSRAEAIARETRRLVARRGGLSIVVNRLGLTMAAAGVDASNVEAGRVLLLPEDPDASARRLRRDVAERTGTNVAVLVTDTAGRPWREGQTDIAIGAAGLQVVESFAGRADPYGNVLAVTAPAVADELAGAAELASGKLGRRPFAVIRGRDDLVLDRDDDGPGALALLRPEGGDLFGLGAREAVLTALRGSGSDSTAFGAPAASDELRVLLAELTGVEVAVHAGELVVTPGPDGERVRWVAEVAAYAHGWRVTDSGSDVPGTSQLRLRPGVAG